MASPAKNDKAVMAFVLLLVVCCCCSCSSSVLAFTGKGTDPAPAPGPAPPSNNNTYITEFGLISPNTGHNWHAEGLTPEQCRAKAVEKGDNAYGMSTQYHPDVIAGKNKVSCWSRKIPGVGSDAFTGLVPTGQGGNLDSHIAGCTTIGKKVSNSCGIPPAPPSSTPTPPSVSPYYKTGSYDCTGDWRSQITKCTNESSCKAIGQHENGCWQKFAGDTWNPSIYATDLGGNSKRMVLQKKTAFKQFYYDDGGCVNESFAKTRCRDGAACTAVGKQSNGCWHTLQNEGPNGEEKDWGTYNTVILRKDM